VEHDPGLHEAQLPLWELADDDLARQVERGFVLGVVRVEVRQRVMGLGEGGPSIFRDRDSVEVADARHLKPLVVRGLDRVKLRTACDETLDLNSVRPLNPRFYGLSRREVGARTLPRPAPNPTSGSTTPSPV
jgi:hypothetical protein